MGQFVCMAFQHDPQPGRGQTWNDQCPPGLRPSHLGLQVFPALGRGGNPAPAPRPQQP